MEQTPAPPQTKQLHVKYETFTAQYSNQAIIVGTPEEIYLDFSSGTVTDPGSGQSLLPIHTRIAMTHANARRLLQALEQSLAKLPAPASAALPRLDS